MKRKVVKHGSATLTISIPAKWARQHGIKAGDELEIEEKGNFIEVKCGAVSDERVKIELKDFNNLVDKIISAYYKLGINEIEVRFSDENILRKLQGKLLDQLIGYEVVKQGKNYAIIKNIANGSIEDFDTILRRAFLVSINMIEDSLEFVKKKSFKSLQDTRYLEIMNNKFTTFCRRILIMEDYKEHKKLPFIYCVVEELEKIMDRYKYLNDYLSQNKEIEIKNFIIDSYKETNELFKSAYELFYNFNLEKTDKLYESKKELIGRLQKKLETSSKEEAVLLRYLIDTVDGIANMTTFILGVKSK